MYKNSTVLDKKILNALNKKSFISAIIVLCVGFLTIIASVFMFIDKDKYYGIIYLVCSILLIALAGYLLIYLNKINKKIENSINECEDEVGAKYLKDQNKAIIAKLDKLVADCEDLSNKISALLSEYSAYTKEVKLAKENYLKVKPEYEKLSEEVNAKKEQINKRLKEKEKEIDSEVMEKYKLKKKEQPSQKILYKCEGDFCAYCNQELSGLAKSKLNEHNVIECENCHKLLYN